MRNSMMNGGHLAPTPERDMLAAGIDIIPDRKNNLGAKRLKRGECPTCGQPTHKVALFGKNKPLTEEGKVYKGRCLNCHPLEGYIRRPTPAGGPPGGGVGGGGGGGPGGGGAQHHHHPTADSGLVIPRNLELPQDYDDEDFSVVSGITMDMRLIQGARNWHPSDGVDYESDDEPPPLRTGGKGGRPEPSLGGDDPYADSMPDPGGGGGGGGLRPPRTMPSYAQSMRNLGMRGSSNRDFGGGGPNRLPPLGPTGHNASDPHGRRQSEASADLHGSRIRNNRIPPHGYNNRGPRNNDPYDYHDGQQQILEEEEEDQNYMGNPAAGYPPSGNGPLLDADGYPIASNNHGWNKADDMLPPGGMESLFKRKSSVRPVQKQPSMVSNNGEIEFNPTQKLAPPPPSPFSPSPEMDEQPQQHQLQKMPPPPAAAMGEIQLDTPPPLNEEVEEEEEDDFPPQEPNNRATSMESGPMYQSDDFPTYVEDDIMPPGLNEQKTMPLFTNGRNNFTTNANDEHFQMDTIEAPVLMASKTTGPELLSRFNNNRRRPPSTINTRPGMETRVNSNLTAISGFTSNSDAPPLATGGLRGRGADDDDIVQDPMSSNMPTPVGMASMGVIGAGGGQKGVPYNPESSRSFPNNNNEIPNHDYKAAPDYDWGKHPNGSGDGHPGYIEDSNDVPHPDRGDYGVLDERKMQYDGNNVRMPPAGHGPTGMSTVSGPMFAEDDMNDHMNRNNYNRGTNRAGRANRRDYNSNAQGYAMAAVPPSVPEYDNRGEGRKDMKLDSPPSPVGDHNMEDRRKPAGMKDTSSHDDNGMQSLGSHEQGGRSSRDRDYDLGVSSGSGHMRDQEAGTAGRSNDMAVAAAASAPAYASSSSNAAAAARGSAQTPPPGQVSDMFRKLSLTEQNSPGQTQTLEVSPKSKKKKRSKKDKKGQTIQDIPAILHCLNLDEANSNLREKGLYSLSEILWKSGEKARSFIVEHKGVETLVNTMWSDIGDDKVQAAALAFLFSLSASPDGRASGDMLSNEESICDTLLFSMQTHLSNPGIQLHGCAILACLASASSNNPKVSDGSLSGGLLMVVNAMGHHSRSREIQKAGLHALYNQCLLSIHAESNKRSLMDSSLDNGGTGIDAVISAMRNLQDDVVAMGWACRLCWGLSSSQDLVKSLANTSIADIISELCQMYTLNPDASTLVEAAFGVIANLSYLENKRSELERVGVVQCLIDGIRHHAKDLGVNIEACSAMANLGVSQHVREAMVRSGAVDCVVHAIQTFGDDEDLMSEATRALVCLAIDSRESKESIAMPDVISALIEGNKRHREAKQLHGMTCALLASLAVSGDVGGGGGNAPSSVANSIVGGGGVDAIVQALETSSDEKVRDAACLAYRNLACELEDSDQILQKGAVKGIVEAMGKFGNCLPIQSNGCCAIWNLAYKTERDPGTIVGSDGIKNIVKAMQSHLESGELLEFACGALGSVVDGGSVERKKDVVGNGAIDAVACAVVMHPGRVSTLEKAFGVLANVSLERPLAEAIANAQGVNIIVEAMRNNGSSVLVLEAGCTALRNLIFQFPANASEASSVVSVVINAMKDNPDEVGFQQEACNLLWVLAAEAENCQSKILSLDGVAVVMKCMEIPEVQEAALGAFRQLASGSNMTLP